MYIYKQVRGTSNALSLPLADCTPPPISQERQREVGEKGVSKFVPPRDGERTEMQVRPRLIDR